MFYFLASAECLIVGVSHFSPALFCSISVCVVYIDSFPCRTAPACRRKEVTSRLTYDPLEIKRGNSLAAIINTIKQISGVHLHEFHFKGSTCVCVCVLSLMQHLSLKLSKFRNKSVNEIVAGKSFMCTYTRARRHSLARSRMCTHRIGVSIYCSPPPQSPRVCVSCV